MGLAPLVSALLQTVGKSSVLSTILLAPTISDPSVSATVARFVQRIFGSHILAIILGSLRAMSQVSFGNNAVGGILILIGCFVSDPRLASMLHYHVPLYIIIAVLGILGSIFPTLVGHFHPSERVNSANGLHGYNGFLIGLAAGYFNAGIKLDETDWIPFLKLVLPVCLLSVFSFYFHLGIRNLSRDIPPFTLAYNLILSCWLMWVANLGDSSAFLPSYSSPNIPALDITPIAFDSIGFGWLTRATLAGIGQVYFMPHLGSSILILSGLLVGSPLIGLMALYGSALGVIVAMIGHAPIGAVDIGLSGYNGALLSVGIGCFYFVFSWGSFLVATVGVVMTVLAQALFTNLLVHPIGPALTLPFCFVGAILSAAATNLPVVKVVILDFPERHILDSAAEPKLDDHLTSVSDISTAHASEPSILI
jgi:urea transporter